MAFVFGKGLLGRKYATGIFSRSDFCRTSHISTAPQRLPLVGVIPHCVGKCPEGKREGSCRRRRLMRGQVTAYLDIIKRIPPKLRLDRLAGAAYNGK